MTIVLAVRGSSKGVAASPESAWQGRVYGISWSVAMLSVYVLGIGLAQNGASDVVLAVFYPSAFSFVAGLMLLSTALLFESRSSLLLGSVLIVAALVAPFLGYPYNYLAMAVLGGGSYFVTGVVLAIISARNRRSLRVSLG